MSTDALTRSAATLVGCEAVGVAALAGWQVVAASAGDTGSLVSAIALIVLTLVGAALLAAFAVAVWRGASWGRSGGIVAQLLIVAVAGGAATGEYAHPLTALAIAAPAALTGVLLVVAAIRAGRARNTVSS